MDISQNIELDRIWCYDNQLNSLDASNNPNLILLACHYNQLTSLDLRNGNNQNTGSFHVNNNPNLYCINVDDSNWANNNWTASNGNIDTHQYFSNNCSGTTGISQLANPSKKLVDISDLMGRATHPTPNTLLFYIYDDGSVEKRIQLER